MLWGFEGRQLLAVAAGFSASIALFRLFYDRFEMGGMAALIVAALPLAATVGWLLAFVTGKPRHYAAEFFEWHGLRFRCRLDLPASFLEPKRPAQSHPYLA